MQDCIIYKAPKFFNKIFIKLTYADTAAGSAAGMSIIHYSINVTIPEVPSTLTLSPVLNTPEAH